MVRKRHDVKIVRKRNLKNSFLFELYFVSYSLYFSAKKTCCFISLIRTICSCCTIFSAIKNCLWLIRSILVQIRHQLNIVRLRKQHYKIVRLRNEKSAKKHFFLKFEKKNLEKQIFQSFYVYP